MSRHNSEGMAVKIMQKMRGFDGDQHVAEDEGECFLDFTLRMLELCKRRAYCSSNSAPRKW
jgi:hypothetical protein